MEYSFEIVEENLIRIGDKSHVLAGLGINSSQFYDYYKHLKENYGLKIKKINFPYNEIYDNPNLKGTLSPITEMIHFIIYCNELEKREIDISNLIRQIDKCTDYLNIRHASSLSLLSYIYDREGHGITFLPKNGADFEINDIKAEVKRARPDIVRRKYKTVMKNGVKTLDIKNAIILRISRMISSRLQEGMEQADLVFFDFSDDINISILPIFNQKFDRIIEPIEKRLIVYTNKFVPEGLIHKMINGVIYNSLEKTYPDIFTHNGYHIDFDEEIWDTEFY